VVRGGGDPALQLLYSRRWGLCLRRLPRYPGTATGWQNHEFRPTLRLPAGRLSPREVARHAAAVLALARAVARPRIHW
jgi:murein peptide amidase A